MPLAWKGSVHAFFPNRFEVGLGHEEGPRGLVVLDDGRDQSRRPGGRSWGWGDQARGSRRSFTGEQLVVGPTPFPAHADRGRGFLLALGKLGGGDLTAVRATE